MIHFLSYIVNVDGVKEIANSYQFKKTATGFVVNKQSSFGGKTTRLKTEDILKVDSYYRTDIITPIQYHTWYFEGSKEAAKELLLNKILIRSNEQKTLSNEVYKQFINFKSNETN